MVDSLFGEEVPSFQDGVVKRLAPYFPTIWKSFYDPWNDFVVRREQDPAFSGMPSETAAQWLTYRATQTATQLFAHHHPDIRIQDKIYGTRQMYAMLFEDEESRFIVHLKKLRPRLLRSNYATKHNSFYWRQNETLPFKDRTFHFICGYRLLKSETEMQLYLTYPIGKRVNGWAYPFPDQSIAASLLSTVAPITSHGGEDERKRRVVAKPKRDGKKKRKSDGA